MHKFIMLTRWEQRYESNDPAPKIFTSQIAIRASTIAAFYATDTADGTKTLVLVNNTFIHVNEAPDTVASEIENASYR